MMLKTIGSADKLAFNKNNGSKSVSEQNNSNDKVDRFDVEDNNMKYAKKSKK